MRVKYLVTVESTAEVKYTVRVAKVKEARRGLKGKEAISGLELSNRQVLSITNKGIRAVESYKYRGVSARIL